MNERERVREKIAGRKYPCIDCGKLRTKAEGGTTFTVCDACWEKRHGEPKADEDGLLTDEDWDVVNKLTGEDVIGMTMDAIHGRIKPTELAQKIVDRCNATAKAQQALTAAAKLAGKDRKCRERMIKSYRNGVEQGNAECQAKLEQVLDSVEYAMQQHFDIRLWTREWWHEFKEKWLKEGK